MSHVHAPNGSPDPKRIFAMRVRRVVMLTVALFVHAAFADPGAWLQRAGNHVSDIYRNGNIELYLPLHTYHLRFAYTSEKINNFEENPGGVGIGRGLYDSDGDWHGLYAMGFQDSHHKPAWMGGYGYKTFWRPGESGDWKVGVGYTVFLMTRTDIAHYTPFPGILPVASVSYRNFNVETAYLPGGKGFGNILFFWGKYEFGQ